MLALTSLHVTFIFDSACLSASFGDKGCSVLQIFSKQQMLSVELSSYCSRCVVSQQFAYFFFVKRSAILYDYQNNSNVMNLLFLLSLDSLTKGRPSDGFFLNVEDLIRQAIRSFDYPECTIFKQLVQTIAPVEKVGR